jgi:hypothetical protein
VALCSPLAEMKLTQFCGGQRCRPLSSRDARRRLHLFETSPYPALLVAVGVAARTKFSASDGSLRRLRVGRLSRPLAPTGGGCGEAWFRELAVPSLMIFRAQTQRHVKPLKPACARPKTSRRASPRPTKAEWSPALRYISLNPKPPCKRARSDTIPEPTS